MEHSFEAVYYVHGLKYILSSVLEICDEQNKVKCLSEKYVVTNLLSWVMILIEKRCKNMYIADLNTAHSNNITFLCGQGENTDQSLMRLVHVRAPLLNKLVSRDLVLSLLKIKFADDKVCDACVKKKQIRPSFKWNMQAINLPKNFRAEMVNSTCIVTTMMILRSLISMVMKE